MKYENFVQAAKLVQQIDNKQFMLNSLESPACTVIINENEQYGRIMTIGAYKSYEHEYTPAAIQFIDIIKADLVRQIYDLKIQLDAL